MDYEIDFKVKEIRGGKHGDFKPVTDHIITSPDEAINIINNKYNTKKGFFNNLFKSFDIAEAEFNFLNYVLRNEEYIKSLIAKDKKKELEELLK